MKPKTQPACQYVEREPIFSKKIGSFTIDPSEYVNERGAYIMDKETRCMLVADPGETYCPRHKLIVAMSKKELKA